MCVAKSSRSSFIYRERFNLNDARLLEEEVVAAAPVVPVGGLFAAAWRNYIKSVFKKGFMFTVAVDPETLIYVAENKTLAGQEVRGRDDEASGRPLVLAFFRRNTRGFAEQRVGEGESLTQLKLSSLTLAELLQNLGYALPADPDRTSQEAELLFEARYQDLVINRFACEVAPGEGPYVYSLGEMSQAEVAFAEEETLPKCTKMTLARLLQREGEFDDGESLKSVWELPAHTLQTRAEGLLPAAAPAPAAAVPAVPARGRGRGGGGRGGRRGGRGRGARGRG